MPKTTNRTAVVVAVMLANFLSAIDLTIVGTAMPTIIGSLGGLPLMSWVFSGFLLASTVTVPIYGKLSDLYGRKSIFIISCLIVVIGSILCALSTTMVQLILFRVVQGLGAGGIMAVATTIVGDIFSVEERGKMQGLFSTVWGVSAIVGPVLGGVIIQLLSWHWVFYINVPIALIAVLVLVYSLHEDIEKKKHQIDYLGAITLSGSMTALLFALLSGGTEFAWLSTPIFALFGLFLVLLIWFVLQERKAQEPLVPLDLFAVPVILVSVLAGFLTQAVLMGVSSYIPSYVQGVWGGTATQAGLALMPLSIGWPLAAFFGGRKMMEWGFRRTALIGVVLIAVTSVLLNFVTPELGYPYAMAVLFVMGMGMGLSSLAFLVAVQSAVPWNRRGVATASLQFIRSLGAAIGVAVMGAVMNARIQQALADEPSIVDPLSATNDLLDEEKRAGLTPDLVALLSGAFDTGLHAAFVLLAVFGIGGLLLTLFFPRERADGKAATADPRP